MAFIKAEKLKHKFVRRDEQGEIEDVTPVSYTHLTLPTTPYV